MKIELTCYHQDDVQKDNDYKKVLECSSKLLSYLNQESTLKKIDQANQPGSNSLLVQNAIKKEVQKLGFISEKNGLFSQYVTKGLRPDYFKRVNESGILFEVERGKTTQNNMDLLDLWKCHICEEAHYLFLLVPKALKQSPNRNSTNTYNSVCGRLGTFFEKQNYIDVKAVFIFGY
ncbi:hypothetical protein SAMN05421781_0296 [Marinococcus luteus]|uniref:Restriction endonuclease BglII n=1 Tax=Marinococcus luteus TaxID=1122204 RepID=A0A1H2QFJ0_9BACI|nr:hypothetical protein [Marinococcus luteus]SDW05855.1 hypothetical protein SAMN05421781_0296 [Marinococcus luteus]